MVRRTKESRKRIKMLMLYFAFFGMLLVATTYAWFTAQNDVYISNLEGKIEVVEGIEISLDGEAWGQTIDFTKITDVSSTTKNEDNVKAYEGNKNLQPTELLPVSTAGTHTTNSNYLDIYSVETNGTALTNVIEVDETAESADGFYAFDIFLRNISKKTEGADDIYLNTKSYVTVLNNANGGLYSTRASNAESGLQNTVRVGFARYGTTISSGSDQAAINTFVQNSTNAIDEVSIWEPNANYHVNNIVNSYNKKYKLPEENPLELSVDKTLRTYALKSTASKLTNIYDHTDSSKLLPQITTQTEVDVSGEGKVILYNVPEEKKLELTSTTEETPAYFALDRNTITKVRMYIWLEGQDIDCVNYASIGGGIEVNIGIEKKSTEGEDEEEGYVSAMSIFDAAGSNPDGLHIGDFVNYNAGTWTQEEIDAIQTGMKGSLVTANGTAELPMEAFQFGGFTAGSSRNENSKTDIIADMMGEGFTNFVKDENGENISGWRVFDIADDGTVTLISAGNPEDYYHPYDGTNPLAYASEYILTGKVNSESGYTLAEAESMLAKRNWGVYVNPLQKATSATVLTKSRLDSWYSKYIASGANTYDETIFQKIYQTPYTNYQNLIDNSTVYWLAEAYDSILVYVVNPGDRCVSGDGVIPLGVRVLVSLSSEVKFTEEKTGTKIVQNENSWVGAENETQTYNCWGIK